MSEGEFTLHMRDMQFYQQSRIRPLGNSLSLNVALLTNALIYHKSIFVASVNYWIDDVGQAMLLVTLAPHISVQAVAAIKAELEAGANPFVAYINALEIAF